MNAKARVAQMTLEEKASLCSGKDFWHTKGVERLGLLPVMVTDGPHGLRKQAGESDHLGIMASVPATCFPTASATACSFDRELLADIGAAIAEECRQEQVAVILGPGMNSKRSPLCGRNFEYFSEDPCLSGELAAAYTNGVQKGGVGVSLKHYAANNQESRRMTIDSVVDERALREIYLSAFETAVKKAAPWTVMCSYNKLDGTYVSQNRRLLHDILRDEWGYNGLVMTDWGATDDRVQGLAAGLDLEMPGSGGVNDKKIVEAVRSGALDEKYVNRAAERVTTLIDKTQENAKPGYRYDADAHHKLARRAAAESCVLLKNEHHLLPLKTDASLAVIGAFAKQPRYQGAGSSRINPTRIDTLADALAARGFVFAYAEGYSLAKHAKPDETRINEAVAAAKGKDAVIIIAGLPDEYESEGFDRTTMAMPESHTRLIEAVCAVNPHTAVILSCGAPVEMPWADKASAVLMGYLGGQAGGAGLTDVLSGDVNPSGKLAETFPVALADNPSAAYFPGNVKTVEYRESIYVGYRYYDAAGVTPAYPFGHGLSYTTFEYTDIRLDGTTVLFTVTNTGAVAGAETAQLYIGMKNSVLYRAVRELKGFDKVYLQPGESKTITITLDRRAFAYYNTAVRDWAVEGGTYEISVGASSRDIRLRVTLEMDGDGAEDKLRGLREQAAVYYKLPAARPLTVPDTAFAAVLGRPIPPASREKGEAFTVNSTLDEIKDTFIGKIMLKQVMKQAAGMLGGENGEADSVMADMGRAVVMEMPLRALGMMSGGMVSPRRVEGIVDMANRKMLSGMVKLICG